MNEWLSVRFDRTKKGKRVIERYANWKASIFLLLLLFFSSSTLQEERKTWWIHPICFSLKKKKKKERATTTQVRLPLLLFEGSRTAERERERGEKTPSNWHQRRVPRKQMNLAASMFSASKPIRKILCLRCVTAVVFRLSISRENLNHSVGDAHWWHKTISAMLLSCAAARLYAYSTLLILARAHQTTHEWLESIN